MLDGHYVVRAPARDDLRGITLRVQGIDRDDRACQVSERLQQVPDGGNLIALRVHGDLAEHGADAVRERCDQVRGLPVPALRAADGLAVDRDHQPAACPPRPRPQPRAEDPVEHVRADQGERAPERRLLRRPACRAEPGQHLLAGVGGPLPDRGERPRPRDHRRHPDGQQPGEGMPPPAPLPRVRDLGKEVKQVPAAGSSHRGGRWHRRASLVGGDG